MSGVKRRRAEDNGKTSKANKLKKQRRSPSAEEDDPKDRILLLESQILESRRHYNNIATLLSMVQSKDTDDEIIKTASVAMCRVYVRLLASGSMEKSKGMAESELVVVQWLKERYQDYIRTLLEKHSSGEIKDPSFVLTLLMRLVKAEVGEGRGQSQRDSAWKSGVFAKVVHGLILAPTETDLVRKEFLEKFMEFDDVRLYTYQAVASPTIPGLAEDAQQTIVTNSISLLSAIEKVSNTRDDIDNLYGAAPELKKHPLLNPSAHKKQAQEAWLAVLRSGLTTDHRKSLLGIMTTRILPHFSKAELLTDFLTDSYNVGGAVSLLALSGLFYLMQEKNLDYPSFFPKLYSLLDENLLHSKHRSRFFRLLDTFMASTHLPAVLVASFIKRLSRLALNAPPAGIVVVVPWVYNMLKAHPACTFMVHREVRDSQWKETLEEEGMDDPFDMNEEDPMQTDAIESSLWELETLQSHYHPNVATLARIISEQFTKRRYELEDFLDHSYSALIETELGKELKKPPVVEFEIPKRIFTADEADLNPLGKLMSMVLQTTE